MTEAKKEERVSFKQADDAWRAYKAGQVQLTRLERYARLNATMKADRTRYTDQVSNALNTLNRFFMQCDKKHGEMMGGPQTKPLGYMDPIMVRNLHDGHSATIMPHRRRPEDVVVFEASVPKGWSLIPSDELFDLRVLENLVTTTEPRL